MRIQRTRSLPLLAAAALSLVLVGCGGGSSEPEAPPPSFAGTYLVTLNKTRDCGTGSAQTAQVIQTVTQSGRDITLLSNTVTLQGRVDADNAGFSTSTQTTSNDITVTSTVIYRTSSTPGLYGVGMAFVASGKGQRCEVAYNGQAELQ
jgi:hypothetical protein